MLQDHQKAAIKHVQCKVITISDTRTKATDKSGALLIDYLKSAGHEVVEYDIVRDEQQDIQTALTKAIQHPEIDAILLNGGTGIAKRDVTIETVQPLFDKEIVGFGEIFRYLSYTEDIGSAAILSRAIAGVSADTVIFSMPGSSGAVRLAMEKLIIPEIGHIVMEVKKDL